MLMYIFSKRRIKIIKKIVGLVRTYELKKSLLQR